MVLFVTSSAERFPGVVGITSSGAVSNKGGQTDRIPQCSFVPNGTSLAQLHSAAYRQRSSCRKTPSHH